MKIAAKKPLRKALCLDPSLDFSDGIDIQPEKEIILSIEGTSIKTYGCEEPQKKQLVIPLPPPRCQNSQVMPSQKGEGSITKELEKQISNHEVLPTHHQNLSLDEQATRELLGETRLNNLSDSRSTSNQLVITCTIKSNSSVTSQNHSLDGNVSNQDDTAGLNIDRSTSTQPQSEKRAPLLMANIAPELLGLQSEEERFKKDISLRADDMDANSTRYKSIPVNEFGAAMLRGMGWKGPTKDDEEKEKKLISAVIPRESRLGLGASHKPPDEKGNNKKNEKQLIEWKQKAEEKLRKQSFEIGDIIWLRDQRYLMKRARVVAVNGVPGLDRIRVCLEIDGSLAEVKRTDAVAVPDADLKESPYVDPAPFTKSLQPPISSSIPSSTSLMNSTSNIHVENPNGDTKEGRGKLEDLGSGGQSKRARYDRESNNKLEQDVVKKSDENRNKVDKKSKSSWILPNLRVRVITEKLGNAYLQKGTIIDVVEEGVGVIRLDSGVVLERVKEKYLETVLPSVGASCIVLVGKHKGQLATLLEKKKQEERVILQLSEEFEIIEMSMNHVAAV